MINFLMVYLIFGSGVLLFYTDVIDESIKDDAPIKATIVMVFLLLTWPWLAWAGAHDYFNGKRMKR